MKREAGNSGEQDKVKGVLEMEEGPLVLISVSLIKGSK
jgi:hypothetical protein